MNSLPGGRVVSFRHLVSFFHVNSFIGSVRKKFSLWSFGITLTTTCTTKTKITIPALAIHVEQSPVAFEQSNLRGSVTSMGKTRSETWLRRITNRSIGNSDWTARKKAASNTSNKNFKRERFPVL